MSIESQALSAIYGATGGNQWINNDNWFSGPIAQWYGVITNDAGEVTELNFLNNGLVGEIPAEIGNLAMLEKLEWSQNTLSGPIPAEVGNLAALRFFFASDNQFEGNIPVSFEMLSDLTHLELGNNPSMSGTLPLALTAVQLTNFSFDNTGLCEDVNPAFQSWLATIATVNSSGCTNVAIETNGELPDAYALHQNYPNPFNPSTVIRFDMPEAGQVRISIYNVYGQLVEVIEDRRLPAGQHEVQWKPGRQSSGVYYYRFESGKYSATRQLTFLK